MTGKGQTLLVTGQRGAGKTTLCCTLAAAARQAGWQVAGLLSPARLVAGQKVEIEAEDLRTGVRRRLAIRSQPQSPTCDKSTLPTPGWTFDPEALAWGNAVLQRALPCDLLVVDELGPLELQYGQGWMAGLQALDERNFRLALAVIRPELLDIAQARWPQAKTLMVPSVGQVPSLAEALIRQHIGI